MIVSKHSPLPNPTRRGRMVVIYNGDVRRAPAIEQWFLNVSMTVSSASKHDNIIIIVHTNDWPSIIPQVGD